MSWETVYGPRTTWKLTRTDGEPYPYVHAARSPGYAVTLTLREKHQWESIAIIEEMMRREPRYVMQYLRAHLPRMADMLHEGLVVEIARLASAEPGPWPTF